MAFSLNFLYLGPLTGISLHLKFPGRGPDKCTCYHLHIIRAVSHNGFHLDSYCMGLEVALASIDGLFSICRYLGSLNRILPHLKSSGRGPRQMYMLPPTYN